MNDDCTAYDCTNIASCYRCTDRRLYKPGKGKQFSSFQRKKNNVDKNAENSWEGLEGSVVNSINKVTTTYVAERQIRSGAFWWAPGDIDDNIIFAECKERKGKEVVSRGTKNFTIDKEWIDKGLVEAKTAGNKPFFLPFRFKGDDTIWTVTNWDWIGELVSMVKTFMMECEKQKILIEAYKKKIKELGGDDKVSDGSD